MIGIYLFGGSASAEIVLHEKQLPDSYAQTLGFPSYDVFDIHLSSDDKRLAYVENLQSGGDYVVVDGVKGKQYDDIDKHSLTFSRDGQLAYAAREG